LEHQGRRGTVTIDKDLATLLRTYADAVDLDRGFVTGLTDTMRDAAAELSRLREQRDAPTHRKQNVEYWRARSRVAEARCARLQQALAALEAAVSDALGSMAFYFGPNARTAVSRESSDRFKRIKAARDEAREALVGPDTPAEGNYVCNDCGASVAYEGGLPGDCLRCGSSRLADRGDSQPEETTT